MVWAGKLALYDGVGGLPWPSAVIGGCRRGAWAGEAEAVWGEGADPVFLCPLQADQSERRPDAEPAGAWQGKVGAVQGIQPPWRGSGDADTAEACQIPRAGFCVGGIPAGPGDQRPGHRCGYGYGQECDCHRRAFQGGIVGGNEGTDRTGEPKFRSADEAVAFGEWGGNGFPW